MTTKPQETQIEDLIRDIGMTFDMLRAFILTHPEGDLEAACTEAERQVRESVSALLREEAPTQYSERDLMQMFSDGVDVARSYGDNAFHLWGPLLERQFRRAFERLKSGEGQCVQAPTAAPKGGEE